MTEETLVRQPYEVRNRWVLLFGGILSLLAGMLAIAYPFAAAVGFEIFLGAALVVVGAFELARAFSLRKAGKILAVTVFGILALAAGALLLLFPIRGVAALTIVLASFLIAGGLVKIWGAVSWRTRPGWPWMMVSGVLSLVLGGMLLALMPESALWALGLLVGIDLIFFGVSQLVVATRSSRIPGEARRTAVRSPQETGPRPG